jgi:hypothetical protein
VVHFVVNVDLLRRIRVLAVDMWKGNRGGVNADSTPAHKKRILSIVVYAKNFLAIIIYKHMTPVRASGESFIEQDSLRIERKSVRKHGYKAKYKARTLIPNIKTAN